MPAMQTWTGSGWKRLTVNRNMMKKITLAVWMLTTMLACAQETPGNMQWSVMMADADIKRNPEAWRIDFVTKPKWNYTNGLMCSALFQLWERTGDDRYFDYIKAYADQMIREDGTINTYKLEEYNIDKVNSGKYLFGLYKQTSDEKYLKAIRLLREQMRTHPRTSEGGFWHKKIYPHQMWLDGLYMGAPFLVQYAKEFNEPALFDDVALQIHLIEKHTYDHDIQLYHHAWDESREQKWADRETGRSPHVWGRAMGWYAMALVDVLDFFPLDHPERGNILNSVRRMTESIVRYQDEETGLWYQVVDQGGRAGNYLEGSASSMFAYFLLKAVKHEYIDKSYFINAEKAYKGIIDRLIRVDDQGEVHITQVCGVAGLGGTPYRDGSYEYYINEIKRDNDPKAVGPFIMASLLWEDRTNWSFDR